MASLNKVLLCVCKSLTVYVYMSQPSKLAGQKLQRNACGRVALDANAAAGNDTVSLTTKDILASLCLCS